MSKIEGKHQSTISSFGNNENAVEKQKSVGENGQNDNVSVYVENNDHAHDKFSARQGIDRSDKRDSREHDLHGKHKGDTVKILDGTTELVGTILSETKDTVDVLVDGTVYTVSKNNAKSRCHRKATPHERSQARIEEQNQLQAQRSEVAREQIKETYQRYDTRMAEQKRQIRVEIPKKIELGVIRKEDSEQLNFERNKIVTKQFQVFTEDEKHQSLSIAEIILKQDADKNDKV